MPSLKKKLWMDLPVKPESLNAREAGAEYVLKGAQSSMPVLTLSTPYAHTTLDTSAFNNKVGCFLLQKQKEKTKRAIEYRSRTRTYAKIWYGNNWNCLDIFLICTDTTDVLKMSNGYNSVWSRLLLINPSNSWQYLLTRAIGSSSIRAELWHSPQSRYK